MMRMWKRQNKRDNQGYTLIELIVAIAILAIIAIPLMQGFVSSARMNAKAREIEQATSVAQNVMEEIKVTPVEKLLQNCTALPTSLMTEDGEIVDMNTYYLPTWTRAADGVNYRVDIVMEDGPYDDATYSWYTDYNLEKMAQLYDMNAAYDAFFILEKAVDDSWVQQLSLESGDSETIVRNGVKRNIYVDIKEELGTRSVEVNVAYTYRGKTHYMAPDNLYIYTSSSIDTYLRNVYVFFEPLGVAGTNSRETITVRNYCCRAGKEPVHMYLVKQGATYDANYKVAVNVMEQSRDLSTYGDAANINVMTGICTNLSFPKDATDAVADQIKVSYSTYDGGYEETFSSLGVSADELVELKDLAASERTDWVYRVLVEVRKEDAAIDDEVLAQLTGTKTK